MAYPAGDRMTTPANITLYHSVESTCAQKVRLVLTAKQLAWSEKLLNLRKGEQFTAEYLRLNPKGVVPTLLHEGNVIRESTVINEYLDDAFPEPPLKPQDTVLRAMMRLLVKTFDDEVHPAIGILTYAIAMRHQMNKLKSPEELAAHFANIVDADRRQRQRATHQLGLKSPAAGLALATLDKILAAMESTLSCNPWLAGDKYSLADAAAVPYVVRMDSLGLARLWENRPNTSKWLAQAVDTDNCRNTRDPWGGTDFLETVRGYAEQAKADIDDLFGQLA